MDRIRRWLGSLAIKAKMLMGFTCVLVILLAVARTGYWRFQGVADSLRSYVQSVVVVAASQNIDREFLEMRRHVREFAFTGNPDAATAAMASAVRMKVAIEKVRQSRPALNAALHAGHRNPVRGLSQRL
jgi:hypothetical protein